MRTLSRRDFVLGLAATAVPVFTSRKDVLPETPAYYSVQWDNLIGIPCTLFWDGKQDWKAECGEKTLIYTHTRPWQGRDSEFYHMQAEAQHMANVLRQQVYQERRV